MPRCSRATCRASARPSPVLWHGHRPAAGTGVRPASARHVVVGDFQAQGQRATAWRCAPHAPRGRRVMLTGLIALRTRVPHRLVRRSASPWNSGMLGRSRAAGVPPSRPRSRPGAAHVPARHGCSVPHAARRGRRQQLVEKAVEALDLRADQFDQLTLRRVAAARRASSWAAPLQPGQRVAQCVGQALSAPR